MRDVWAVYTPLIAAVWVAVFLGGGDGRVQPPKPRDTTPDLCFIAGRPSRSACEPWGGYQRVWWENVCQPDPSCTRNPDGSSFLGE